MRDGARFNLVRCAGCGVLALHPAPSDEELTKYYSSEYYGSSRRKFIAPIAKLVSRFQGGRARLAARNTPARGRVLDVGCGNGGFLIQMQALEFAVEGTEWTAQSAARVPSEHRIPVHVGDLLSLDLPEHSYDLITLWHVFEHVRRPHETLQRIAALLKPTGRLILSLPNAESAQAQRFGTHWFHHDPPRHLHGFGPESLRIVLDQNGFHIQRVSTWSFEQNPFGYIQSWLNQRGYPRERLYDTLKGIGGNSQAAQRADLIRMATLILPALFTSTLESMRGRGATMTVIASRHQQ